MGTCLPEGISFVESSKGVVPKKEGFEGDRSCGGGGQRGGGGRWNVRRRLEAIGGRW